MKTLVRNFLIFSFLMSGFVFAQEKDQDDKDPFTVEECKLVPMSDNMAMLHFFDEFPGDKNQVEIKRINETLITNFEVDDQYSLVPISFKNFPNGEYFIDVPDTKKVIRIHVLKERQTIKVLSSWYQRPVEIAMR